MTGIPEGATPLGNGFYETANRELHIDLEEFIVAAGGNPWDAQDRETAMRAIEKIVADEQNIPVEVREK